MTDQAYSIPPNLASSHQQTITMFPSFLPLFLLILSLPASFQQDDQMDPHERETLFQIMEGMSSDTEWRDSYPNPCSPASWLGIACKTNRHGLLHVKRLDFGTHPNPSCKENATFPSSIFHLPHLQSIFFLNCFRSTKTAISFPKTPSSSSLRQLSLKSNPALVGVVPRQISSLTSLQVLSLSQNHLSGEIPESIFTIASLVNLDLSYNSFTGKIPPEMGSLKILVGLDLSYNALIGTIPASVGEVGLLQKLDLSSNSLTGSIPESLVKLGLLTFMAMSNNKLKGPLPANFSKLSSLQYLIMDNNPMLMELPPELGKLERLQELRLANSGCSGQIPASFVSLKNLTTLSLENNRLSGGVPAGLGSLKRMYHMNLSNNLLGGVASFDSGFLHRLGRNLDLSGNPGLCIDQHERLSTADVGVGVCGRNGSGNVSIKQQPVKTSVGSVPSTSSLTFLLCVLAIWVLDSLLYCLFDNN